MVIQIRLKKLQASSEHVAAAGQENELPKFELPGEAQWSGVRFRKSAIFAIRPCVNFRYDFVLCMPACTFYKIVIFKIFVSILRQYKVS